MENYIDIQNASKFNKIWDFLIDHDIATEGELQLACGLCGESIDTLSNVIYYKTGYHDIEQLYENEFVYNEMEVPF